MMINAKSCIRRLAPLAMALAAGCAPTYHSCSGCFVDCRYCAPPALPSTRYEGCVCHSDAASKYLSLEPQPAVEDAGTNIAPDATEEMPNK